MNMMEIENAARFAWPALEEQELPYGVLRYACGTDRRSNSLNLFPYAELEVDGMVDATEAFFAERAVAPIVRVVLPARGGREAVIALDTALENRGYEKQAPTLSMLLDLKAMPSTRSPAKRLSMQAVGAQKWLQAWYALTDRPVEKLAVHKALLEKSELSHLFLLRQEIEENPSASGMAVYANQAMGIFGVATPVEHRNKGYASELLAALLEWGKLQGARFAYLQVEESNEAAVSLYRKLGFKKVYSYWYRVGRHSTGSTEIGR